MLFVGAVDVCFLGLFCDYRLMFCLICFMLDIIFSPSSPSYSEFCCLSSFSSFLFLFLDSGTNIQGPFIGILGFSQGAAVAATLTSLLEKNNQDSGLPTNLGWRKINHPPVNFFISVSGFRWDFRKYDFLYPIQTSGLHIIGTAVLSLFRIIPFTPPARAAGPSQDNPHPERIQRCFEFNSSVNSHT